MELLELFSQLPMIGQLMVVLGFLMPFAVLYSFIKYEKPKEDKPNQFVIEGIKIDKGKIQVSYKNK